MSGGPSLAAIAIAILATSIDPAWLLWALAQDAPQSAGPHQERYRAGVELVMVDVTVVDADGTPVTALAPDNFEVRVDDTVRDPVSVQFVDVRGDDRRAPDVPPAGDSPRVGRRFVFVVDRESMPFGHGPQVLAAAGQFIEAFAPGDRAAVWIVSNASGRLTFTHDRAVIKEALAGAYGIAQSPPDDVRLAPGEALLIDKGDPETTRQVVGPECDRLLMSGRPECGQ